MSDNLREALEELAEDFIISFEGGQYAAVRLRAILAAHPDETGTEWGVLGPSGHVVRHSSEDSARSAAEDRNKRLVTRQSATPWKAAS